MHAGFHRTTIISFAVATCLLLLAGCGGDYASQPLPRSEMELNTDRPGLDMQTLRLEQAKPHLCSNTCFSSDGCKAWTYVKPGLLGPDAYCRLKSAIPAPKRSSCCISGIR